VGSAPGDAYLDGALYIQQEPQDAQLSFQLTYSRLWVLLDLVVAGIKGVGLLGAAFLLYVVPGWALLAWLWRGRSLSWGEGLGLSVGISLCVYPVLMVWLHLIGLDIGLFNALLPVGSGIIALLWRYHPWRIDLSKSLRIRDTRIQELAPDVALVVVILLGFAIRGIVIRSLDAPLWGDSQQHATIIQLILDNGGLFESWQPYAPFESLTVHIGFHTLSAVFSWLTGISSLRSTLVVGQMMNGLAFVTLYPLALYGHKKNPWRGIVACLVAGFISPMPAFYVNWGRYPQLAGQVILPVAIWFLLVLLEAKQIKSWRLIPLGALVLAGMSLSYYRMPFYLAAFGFAWLIVVIVTRLMNHDPLPWHGFLRLAPLGIVTFIIAVAWLYRLLGGNLVSAVSAGVSKSTPIERVLGDYQIWRDITFYVPRVMLVALGLSLIWGLIRKDRWGVTFAVWIVGLASLVATRLINLPGSNMMQNFAVLIALYIPVSLVIGGGVGDLIHTLIKRYGVYWRWVIAAFLIAVSLWFGFDLLSVVDTSYEMVTRPDLQAMAWIRDHTQPEATFLVEGFRIYEGTSVVGADAGWWIPILTERGNTMPPQYALFNEQPIDPEYPDRVVGLIERLESVSPLSDEGLDALCAFGVTHIYLGQTQGLTGAGVRQLYSLEDFEGESEVDKVYHQDRVRVYKLSPLACDR
jgi:hypothetical protein